MQYEIRPMSFGEILDTGFRLVRNHALLLIGCALPLYLPLAFAGEQINATNPTTRVVFGIIPMLLIGLLSPIVTAALTLAIGEFYLGRSVTFAQAIRGALGMFVPLVGTFLLAGLAVIGGLLLLIVPGVYLALCFYLATTIAVLEKVYGTKALSRSRELMRGSLLRALGIVLLTWVVLVALGAGVAFVLGLIPMLGPVGAGFVNAVSVAYFTAVSVVLYFDIRCRKEAFDLEHLATLVDGRIAPAVARATA